jgi:hypothetical protein
MKKLSILILALFLGTSLIADEDIRKVGTFTAIENNCSLDVTIKQGDRQEVKVVSPQKYMHKIKTDVQANTLVIDIKGSLSYRNEDLHIEITVKDLNEINNNGSADFDIIGTFNTENLLLDMHGSGDFEGDFDVKNLEISMHGSGDIEISGVNGTLEVSQYGSGDFEGESIYVGSSYFKMNGSGDCEVNGTAAMLELSQNGSGDFDGRGFEVKTAKIRKSSSGEADVHITETLDARLSGSGDLNIKGRPEITDFSVSGSGEINTL